jgi:hypothetical protein
MATSTSSRLGLPAHPLRARVRAATQVNAEATGLQSFRLLDFFDFRIAYYLAPFFAFGLDKI